MADWIRKICADHHIYTSYGVLKAKYVSLNATMASATLLLCVFLAGGLLTYLCSFLPLVEFFGGRRKMTLTGSDSSYHDTSVMLRGRQQHPVNSDLTAEALAALNLALDMQAQGKKEKALKLFQHALVLDPLHADILIEYGEFLEKHERDVLKADHMYSKALGVCPGNSRALANRQRTQPLVEEIDQTKFNRIDKKRDLLYKVPSNHPGVRRMKKEAYFMNIYHSNAIEGNTLTLAQTRSIIETKVAVGGKSLVEQNEVLGLHAALSYINSTLSQRVGRITVKDILAIHKRVLGFVDVEEAGRFRVTQVYVGDFEPPGPSELDRLMDEFIEWLNAEESLKLHPIEYAALAHYKLVTIHPFYDGNGRTSRLLMNLILMQAGFPAVTIRVEDRLQYYEALSTANKGDVRPFIRFIADCTESMLDQFLYTAVENPKEHFPQISSSNRSGERVITVN